MSRWYDKYEKLGQQIENLKEMDAEQRDALIKGIMRIIKEESPELLEDFMLEFPIKIKRRRWYDNDPYLWLLMNGLKNGEDKLLLRVADFLEESQSSKE